MKKNMGTIDKTIRIIIALALIILYATNLITGIFGILMVVVAAVFILTSIFSFCPLYALLGLNSGSKK